MRRAAVWIIGIGGVAVLAGCAVTSSLSGSPSAGVLQPLDYGIIVGYLLFVVVLGIKVGQGQETTEDFFLAGRKMHWFPVGISIMATLFSAISYLGYPGEIYQHGLPITAMLPCFLFVMPIIMFGFMPFYQRLRLTTAYEYLEQRFDVRVRSLASGLFILCRLGWMAAAIYTPSLALHVVTGLPLLPLIIVCGVLATVYTIFGGMKAVIWTDVVQFFVLVGGLGGAVWIVHSHLSGGFTEAIHMARAYDQAHPEAFRLRWDFGWSWTARMTVLGCWIGQLVTFTSDYGVDQVTVQRYLTTPDLKQMQRSFVINLLGVLVVITGLAAVGLGLWAFFQHHAAEVADLAQDKVFPYFIARYFPVGASGLMIAALLAATMSSIDSGLNSVATAVTVDFYERFGWVEESEQVRLRLARTITLATGVVVTVLATLVGRLGDIIAITNKVNNGFKGPLLAIFLLGMLTRKAQSRGVLLGAAVGLGVALYATYWWPEASRPSFLWITLLGLLPTLLLGWLGSLVRPAPGQAAERVGFGDDE